MATTEDSEFCTEVLEGSNNLITLLKLPFFNSPYSVVARAANKLFLGKNDFINGLECLIASWLEIETREAHYELLTTHY